MISVKEKLLDLFWNLKRNFHFFSSKVYFRKFNLGNNCKRSSKVINLEICHIIETIKNEIWIREDPY